MQPVYLHGLASSQAEWLTIRQATIAGNVANADSPGYKARDVTPFSDYMNRTRLEMAATATGHFSEGEPAARAGARDTDESWAVTPSGNSVSLEEELIRAGTVMREYRLNRSVSGAFYRMMTIGIRGMR